MQPDIITIERQYGSGGRTIGKMLASALGVPYYDREIITMAAEDSGINAILFSDERLKPNLKARLLSKYHGTLPADATKVQIDDKSLFLHQAKLIRKLAGQGGCIIIGRCADFILQGRENVARVFVHADAEFCLEQAMKVDSLPAREVRRKIREMDEYRAKYYKFHTGNEWSDVRNYDISLNSGVLGFEGTKEAVLQYLNLRDTCKL